MHQLPVDEVGVFVARGLVNCGFAGFMIVGDDD